MKKVMLSIIILIGFLFNAYSQAGDSTISMMRKKVYQNGQTISNAKLKSILKSNPASTQQFKKYQTNSAIGTTLLVAGTASVLVGAVINLQGNIQESNDIIEGDVKDSYPNGLGFLATGLVLDIIAIPLILSGSKQFKKALFNYNSSFGKTSAIPVQFNLMVNANGLGVRMQF